MTYLNSGPQWWYNTEWKVEKERMVAISGTITDYRLEVLRCIWRRGTGTEEAVLCWPDWMSACRLLDHAEHLGKAIALSYQGNLPSVIFILTIICMDNLASRIELDALTDEWIKKKWYIYTMEYYSAVKKNEKNVICSNMDRPRDYHTKWTKSKRGQISYDITYMWNLNVT